MNLGKIRLLGNFYTNLSFLANNLVIISSILGYLAVKGYINSCTSKVKYEASLNINNSFLFSKNFMMRFWVALVFVLLKCP